MHTEIKIGNRIFMVRKAIFVLAITPNSEINTFSEKIEKKNSQITKNVLNKKSPDFTPERLLF